MRWLFQLRIAVMCLVACAATAAERSVVQFGREELPALPFAPSDVAANGAGVWYSATVSGDAIQLLRLDASMNWSPIGQWHLQASRANVAAFGDAAMITATDFAGWLLGICEFNGSALNSPPVTLPAPPVRLRYPAVCRTVGVRWIAAQDESGEVVLWRHDAAASSAWSEVARLGPGRPLSLSRHAGNIAVATIPHNAAAAGVRVVIVESSTGRIVLTPALPRGSVTRCLVFPISADELGLWSVDAAGADLWSFKQRLGTWVHYGTWQAARVAPGNGSRELALLIDASGTGVERLMLGEREPRFGALNYIVLALYLVVMLAMGVYFLRRNSNTRDYFLGGNRIPWWVAGLSVYATMLSTITFMAVPAKAFASDWTYLPITLTILVLAPLVVRFYLPFFRRLRVTSAYEYIEARFNYGLRAYASAAFILVQFGRSAVAIFLPSLALSTVVGIQIETCILLLGGICVLYTMLGGMTAVVWGDAVQTVIFLAAALGCLVIAISGIDEGVSGVWHAAAVNQKLRIFDWSWDHTVASTGMILVGSLINNLIPYTADQTVVQRYMSTATEAQARRAIWLNAALAVPSGILFLAIGTVLYVYYKEHPDELHPLIADDSILPYFVSQKLPIGFSGFVVAGLFAAAQSTISSSFNSVATAVGSDFVLRLRPRLSEIVQLRIARAVTVVLGACVTLAALAMAAFDIRSLWDASVTLMSLTGSGIAALFALGIFAPRISASAAACGLAASAVLLYWITKYTTVHFFLYGCIGFGTCWLVAFGASVFLPQRRDIADLTWRGIRFE